MSEPVEPDLQPDPEPQQIEVSETGRVGEGTTVVEEAQPTPVAPSVPEPGEDPAG